MSKRIQIGTRASAIDSNNNIWLSNYFFNGLFRINLNDLIIEYVDRFPGEAADKREMHLGAHINGSDVIFMPYANSTIHIYNMENKTFKTINVPKEYGCNFTSSVSIDNDIYFLSWEGNILYYDIKKQRVLKDEALTEEYMTFRKEADEQWNYSIDEDGFSILDGKNHICRINIKNKKIDKYTVTSEYENLEIAYYERSCFWFSLNDSQSMLFWDIKKNSYECYTSETEIWGKEKYKYNPYNKILNSEDITVFSNYNAAFPIKVDKKNKKIVSLSRNISIDDIIEKREWGPIFTDVYDIGETIYFVPCCNKYLLLCNKKTYNINKIPFWVDKEDIPAIYDVMKSRFEKQILNESGDFFDLASMIEYVKY